MAKIIFTSRYLKGNGKTPLGSFINYIATRDGVDTSVNIVFKNTPASEKQIEKIDELMQIVPDIKITLEYEDYIKNPTIKNASELITKTIEDNIDLFSNVENFISYMAFRPRAEKIADHGLFSNSDGPINLEKVKKDIAEHKGRIYTNVVSLRREDAERLNYNNADAWRSLIRSKQALIAENMKIPIENLRWYAAFHNERHHPHIHLLAYNAKPGNECLTKQGIENMRSAFANDIFRDVLVNIYEEKIQARDTLKAEAKERIKSIVEQINNNDYSNPTTEKLLVELSEKLQHTTGKKTYGYLKPELKKLVDEIVNQLSSEDRISELYNHWCDLQNEIIATYKSKFLEPPPLWEQKEFKSIKNAVINEALNIDSNRLFLINQNEIITPEQVETVQTFPQMLDEPSEQSDEDYMVEWTDEYKLARQYFFGKNVDQDHGKAFDLFMAEAEKGNDLALHDVGIMYSLGLSVEADEELANKYYKKALNVFIAVEKTAEKTDYIQYRIGKMYRSGLGTSQEFTQAADWFYKSAEQKNKYAQYSLGGLCYTGNGVEQSYEKAFDYYTLSSDKGNVFASYELAKMYKSGIGTDVNKSESDALFTLAFNGFVLLEQENGDDKLSYRIGQMLVSGTGVQKDVQAAVSYFEKAASVGNANAQYALGKLLLSDEDLNIDAEKAMYWLMKSAEQNNDLAQYALGKLYLTDKYVVKDIDTAIIWLEKSAENNNEFAQYALGKMYLSGLEIPQDIPKAIDLLEKSTEQGNQFAQYTLGKFYSKDGENKDINKALEHLSASAEQGNTFAQYALGMIYFFGNGVDEDKSKAIEWITKSADGGNEYAAEFLQKMADYNRQPSAFSSTINLLRHLSRIISNDYNNKHAKFIRTDKKEMQKIREKKESMGQKFE